MLVYAADLGSPGWLLFAEDADKVVELAVFLFEEGEKALDEKVGGAGR